MTSLANVEFVEGVPDGIEIYELLEDFPESQEALLAIRDKVLGKPLYVGGLVSADARYAAIILEMDRSSVDPLEEIRLDPEGGDGLANLYPQATYHPIEDDPGAARVRGHRLPPRGRRGAQLHLQRDHRRRERRCSPASRSA